MHDQSTHINIFAHRPRIGNYFRQQDMLEVAAKWQEIAAEIEVINVSPLKKNIELEVLAVAWQPHWVAKVKGKATVIPAG